MAVGLAADAGVGGGGAGPVHRGDRVRVGWAGPPGGRHVLHLSLVVHHGEESGVAVGRPRPRGGGARAGRGPPAGPAGAPYSYPGALLAFHWGVALAHAAGRRTGRWAGARCRCSREPRHPARPAFSGLCAGARLAGPVATGHRRRRAPRRAWLELREHAQRAAVTSRAAPTPLCLHDGPVPPGHELRFVLRIPVGAQPTLTTPGARSPGRSSSAPSGPARPTRSRSSSWRSCERRARPRELGGGPPLVLLHGVAASRRVWHHVTPPLAAGRHVVAVTSRASGSRRPPAPASTSTPSPTGSPPGSGCPPSTWSGTRSAGRRRRRRRAPSGRGSPARAGVARGAAPRAVGVAAALGQAADVATRARRALGHAFVDHSLARWAMFGTTVADPGGWTPRTRACCSRPPTGPAASPTAWRRR